MGTSEELAGHRDRLRRRMLEGGGDAFLDHELLEYVLTLAIPRRDTKPVAKALLKAFGSFGAVLAAPTADLTRVGGVGESAAATLKFVQAAAVRLLKGAIVGRPVLGNWQALEDYLHADMAHNARERFRVLLLDARNVLIHVALMSEGTVNQAAVHVREVVKTALDHAASAIILVHNHPSGNSQPSRDDIAMTIEIRDACRPLCIGVHDHIIIGRDGHSSMKALGLL